VKIINFFNFYNRQLKNKIRNSFNYKFDDDENRFDNNEKRIKNKKFAKKKSFFKLIVKRKINKLIKKMSDNIQIKA